MADSSGLLKIGLIGGAAYLAYRQGWLASLGIAGPSTTSSAVAPTSGAVTTTTAPPVGPSLSSLYSALLAASASDSTIVGGMASPDTWNVYLLQVYPALGSAPDPVPIFGGRPNMTAATYWAGMSQWLQQNKGLSGLNGYAGLAGLARRNGWA